MSFKKVLTTGLAVAAIAAPAGQAYVAGDGGGNSTNVSLAGIRPDDRAFGVRSEQAQLDPAIATAIGAHESSLDPAIATAIGAHESSRVVVPYLSQGQGVAAQEFGTRPLSPEPTVVPYPSQGQGIAALEFGTSEFTAPSTSVRPNDRAYGMRIASVEDASLSSGNSSDIAWGTVGKGASLALIGMLLLGAAAGVTRHRGRLAASA